MKQSRAVKVITEDLNKALADRDAINERIAFLQSLQAKLTSGASKPARRPVTVKPAPAAAAAGA